MSDTRTADVRTPRQRCLDRCSRTFTDTHGGALPGGPFPGTHGSPGDVRRCEHGRYWRFIGRAVPFTVDEWELLSRFWHPILIRRVRRVLAEAVADV